MLTTLRQRNFALLWFGGLISMAGNWMLMIALPIYVYQMTGSTLATSLMLIASTVPNIVLGSVAGVFVDRWERKRTMVVTNLLLAVGLLPLLLVQSLDWIWLVYLVGFTQSCIDQFFGPAENALLPRLVGEEHLVPANALNSLNNSLARLIGPALGGFLAGFVGLTGIIVIDAATFLVAALLIALITATSQPTRAVAADSAARSPWLAVWREWRDGLRLIRRNRVIATLMGVTALTAVGEGIFSVLLVVFVNQLLHGGALEIGWLMSAQAVGGLLGGVVIGWVGRRIPPVLLLGASSILFGVGDLLIVNAPLFFVSMLLTIVLFIAVGIPGSGFGASLNTLFQTAVSDEYRGRIFGAYGTTFALLMLAGMAFAGTLGDVIGVVPVLNIQGGGYVLSGVLVLLLLPPVLRAQKPHAAETPRPEPAAPVPAGGDAALDPG
jgi:MFS family permease